MTRQEAIVAIRSVWTQRDGEFYTSEKERAESDAEFIEALRALGVTDEEMDD